MTLLAEWLQGWLLGYDTKRHGGGVTGLRQSDEGLRNSSTTSLSFRSTGRPSHSSAPTTSFLERKTPMTSFLNTRRSSHLNITRKHLGLSTRTRTTTTTTAFIKRCWYSVRGEAEGEECQQLRERFKNASLVDMLPTDKGKCGAPIYILNGISPGDSKGSWYPSNPEETLEYPNEVWHKCCVPEDDSGDGPMTCQKVRLVSRGDVTGIYDDKCGTDGACSGYRDRCLESATVAEYSEHGKVMEPECPKNCGARCVKTYMDRHCVFLGIEPKEGWEGFSQPLDPVSKEKLPYSVVDLGIRDRDELEKEFLLGGKKELL
ncbi:unnamed protein product [Amoebophrya sp. A25]|nr:unnamed protein product [Amoebophrya sp. A25]|eukprot:GSA25T00009630001.1